MNPTPSRRDHAGALERKLRTFTSLGDHELQHLDRLQQHSRRFPPRSELIHQSQVGAKAYVLQNGWAVSYKLLADGSRQVVDFQVPGDFLGLRSLLLRTSDHSATAVTDLTASEIAQTTLRDTLDAAPRLGMALLWSVSRDEAMVVEHLVGIGRRTPLVRTAHFFVELGQRLALVEMGDETRFPCPLNQYLLSDALGMSAIHLNRTLRELRERRLMTLGKGFATIHDPKGLSALAAFENAYLDHVQSSPRANDATPHSR